MSRGDREMQFAGEPKRGEDEVLARLVEEHRTASPGKRILIEQELLLLASGAELPPAGAPGRRTRAGELGDHAAARSPSYELDLGASAFDERRSQGLRDVLSALGGIRGGQGLILATLFEAKRSTGARLPSRTAWPSPPDPAGRAMWRAAERRAVTLYRRAVDGDGRPQDPAIEEALRRIGGGHALPDAVRRAMERELGASLERVRIHTDSVAAEAAHTVRAEAFTVGEDIFFAEGAFAPQTDRGAKLLAHELAHVLQRWQGRTEPDGDGIRVSRPGDPLEREADAVAERIAPASAAAPDRRLVPHGGQPLDGATRAYFEPRIGQSLGDVTVHTGPEAAASAASIGAAAFNVGRDIAFGEGQYAPHTPEGKHLIAHELAHVAQRGGGGGGSVPSLEAEADRSAAAMAAGGPALVSGSVDAGTLLASALSERLARELHWRSAHSASAAERAQITSFLRRLDATERGDSDLRAFVAQAFRGAPDEAALATMILDHGPETGWTPAQRRQLAERTGGGGPAIAAHLDDFARRFNDEFRAQLHALAEGDPLTTSAPTAERGPRETAESRDTATVASGAGVSGERLGQLFTPRQIELLDGFMSTHVIPDRLFDGDEVGHTTAQQRILLSGHILSTGTYAPGSFSERVHARMRGHWVNLVYSYAGCATSLGAGAREQFDHTGALVLGVEETATGEVDGLARDSLDRGLGLGRERFSTTLAREDFDQIQAGDWLYVQNHNSSASGNHSVIFSRWATDWVETPVPHRRAVCMSQGSPDGGGHEEMRTLGPTYSAGPPMVTPVTHITRVSSTTRPMTTVEDLVAILGSGPEATDNATFIGRLERSGGHFDAEMFKAYLREQNDALITELASHRTSAGDSVMTDQQQQIFRDTNEQSTELPVLVRLYQRLRVLVDNAAAIEEERESRGAAIDAHHTEAEAAVAPRRAGLEAQIDAIDDELAQLARDEEAMEPTVEMYSEHTAELNTALAERRALRRERQGYRDERRSLPRADRRTFDHHYGPRLAQIEARLAELAPLIERLSDEEHDTRTDRSEATRAARQIAVRIRQAGDRRSRLQRSLDALEGDSGYHTAHGGVGRTDFNGTDERRTVTGRLRDLVPQPNWSEFVHAGGPAGEGTTTITTTLH